MSYNYTVIQTETIFKRSKYSSDKVTIAAKCNKEISLMGCQLHIKISHETMLVHGSPNGGVICDMKDRTEAPRRRRSGCVVEEGPQSALPWQSRGTSGVPGRRLALQELAAFYQNGISTKTVHNKES